MARSLIDAHTATVGPLGDGPDASPADPVADDGASWPVTPRTISVMATVLAAALAMFHLGHKSLWLDEGYSVGHARMPWSQFWTVLTEREPNGALHALILYPWIRVGDAEWWLRLPSAISATVTVPLVFLLLRRLFDQRVAALGAVLMALNAFSLQFAQEVRAYALVMCLGTASTLLFVAFVQDQRRGQWWAWVAVSATLPFAHLFGFLILGVQVAGALLRQGPLSRPTRRLVSGFVLIGLLSSVVALLVLTGDKGGQADGIPGVSAVRFVGVYARVIGNGGVALLAVVGAVWLATVVSIGRELLAVRPFRPTERQWGFLYLLAWLALPTIAIAVLSPVQPLFGARYFVILVPAAVGFTALALITLPAGWTRRAATTLVLVLTTAAAVGWYVRPPADDIRASARTISAAAEPGDGVVFLPWFVELPFDAYAVRDALIEDDVEPLWPAADWGTFVPDNADHPTTATIAAAVGGHDRVWIVLRDDREVADDRDLAALQAELARDHRQVRRVDLDGVDVLLYARG